MVCWLSLMVAGFSACQPSVMNYTLTDRLPAISPDYTAITLPPNIAPLNFQIDEQGEDFVAKIWSANNDTLTVHCAGGKIQIDENIRLVPNRNVCGVHAPSIFQLQRSEVDLRAVK